MDHHYYHAWLLPVWNIVKYNALGGGGGDGSNLYGTEPPTYYFRNLTLNFNGVFPLSLMSVLVRLRVLLHTHTHHTHRAHAVQDWCVSLLVDWCVFATVVFL